MNPSRSSALLAACLLGLLASVPSTTSATSFSVHWTAPGDDSLTGRASLYDLRYSSAPITAANFQQATPFTGLPLPAPAGTMESFTVSVLPDGVLYYMALRSADELGHWSGLSNVVARLGQTTYADPSALALSFSSPWPNPARQSVRWAYSLPHAAQVQVDVFDIAGRHLHTVATGVRGAGRGELSWDLRDDRGRPVDAGVYFAKARLGSMEWIKRLLVVR